MAVQTPTPPDNEVYNPNLDAQDDEVSSGGNNRLIYILGAIILALVLGYVALPKGSGGGLASATPSFMLDDAAVTATAPTSADSIAAGLKPNSAAAKTDEEAAPAALAKTAAEAPPLAARAASAAASAPASAAAPVAAAPAPAAASEPAPEAAAPEPVAAPANVTLAGKIEDENGRPMVGATVLLKGSSKGTSTDANGNYTMEVPGGADNTLVYGYGGYEDEVVRTSSTKPVNVTLTPRAKTGKRRR